MNFENVLSQFEKRAENAAPIGGVLKFIVDGNVLIIDGLGDANVIKTEDRPADCTITVSSEVLEKLRTGDLNPMTAVMSGKIKVSGDMGLAMKVQSLLK